MSSFRTYWSSLKYHTVTRPSISLAIKARNKLGESLLKHVHDRKVKSQGRIVGLRDRIKGQTRGTLAGNEKYWTKKTKAGLKLRREAAKKARTIQRPLRTHNRPSTLSKVVPAASSQTPTRRPSSKPVKTTMARKTPSSSVAEAVSSSKTHGELRRKLYGQAVRNSTSVMRGANSTETNRNVRTFRKNYPGVKLSKVLRDITIRERTKRTKQAATILSKRK